MTETCNTVRVKPKSAEQCEYVLINADDFNPEVHELHLSNETKDDDEKPDEASQTSEKNASETVQGVLKKRGRPAEQKEQNMPLIVETGQAALDDKGIAYKPSTGKTELQALLDAAA